MHPFIRQDHVATYQRDGAVLSKGLFADRVEPLREGIATNRAGPGAASPRFPGHDVVPGQKLREDWFPVPFSR